MTAAGPPSILSPPGERRVRIGGEELTARECRPCDFPPLTEFLEAMDMKGVMASLNLQTVGGDISLDKATLLGFVSKSPKEVCRLLAALLDPDPLGTGSAAWREAAALRFELSPVSEFTGALGAWLELNASFFAQQAAPVIVAATVFLAALQKVIEVWEPPEGQPGIGNA
jgi:hypothetical protein